MDRKKLLDAAEVLKNLVRNIHLRRELSMVRADPHLAFWRLIYGDLSDMVVLEWCNLFGSDAHEPDPLHWSNVVSDPTKFQKDLFARLQIYESKWRSYWGEIQRYRDQSVARHDMRKSESHPKFDLALEAAYFYFEFVVDQLRKTGTDLKPGNLRDYSKSFAAQCREIASAAMNATDKFQERVY